MMIKFGAALLLAFTTTTLAAAANSTTDLHKPTCFEAPDEEHDVSQALGTCTQLFADFLENFGSDENSTFLWTSNNTKWRDPGVVHLPWTDSRIDTNRTHACLFDVIDLVASGDSYAPLNVANTGLQILDTCFKKNMCGETLLGPSYTTRLTVCATIHGNSANIYSSSIMHAAQCSLTEEAQPKAQCQPPPFSSVQTAGKSRRDID